ncbi:MAG: hypothetical protein KU38_00255 [Sulfurovum sp. FS08-3]|nr:MAG: hypothetical protein KU38_00255 [Sulfurovum sp. FS08-3]
MSCVKISGCEGWMTRRFGSAKRLNDVMDCNQYFESVGATMSHKKRVTRSHLQVADFFSSLKLTLSFGSAKPTKVEPVCRCNPRCER